MGIEADGGGRAMGIEADGGGRAMGIEADGGGLAMGIEADGGGRAMGIEADGGGRAMGIEADDGGRAMDTAFVVARLGRPHGLDGHLGLYVDEADVVYFDQGNSVLIEDRPYIVRAIRRVDRGYQIQFEGITSRQSAESIRGREVEVEKRRELDTDEFWPEDLVGLEARGPDGARLGFVVAFTPGAAQDRVVIEIEGERFEVPFISEFIPMVDIAAGFLEVRPIPGLIEPLT